MVEKAVDSLQNAKSYRKLQLLAWETTQACSLACPHCRASALPSKPEGELTTQEGFKLLKEAALVGPGIVILSGGEPLLREDLEELAAAATANGQTPVVSTNDGARLTSKRISSLKEAGVKRFSFSIHGNTAETHDAFVGRQGTFDEACKAFERLEGASVEFQINTTMTPQAHEKLLDMHSFVTASGAVAWHLFFVVPMGRAIGMLPAAMSDGIATERVLESVAKLSENSPIPIKVTCSPQYARIRAKLGLKPASPGKACMAGDGFAFVSSRGEVKPCGYFERSVGNVTTTPFNELYIESPLFNELRNPDALKGRCGSCPFRRMCGGCRARALAVSGDYLAEDSSCTYDFSQN